MTPNRRLDDFVLAKYLDDTRTRVRAPGAVTLRERAGIKLHCTTKRSITPVLSFSDRATGSPAGVLDTRPHAGSREHV